MEAINSIEKLQSEIKTLRKELLQKNEIVAKQEADINHYLDTIAKYQRMLFGQKRERFTEESPLQLKLDFGHEITQEEIREIQDIVTKKRQEVQQKEKKERESSPRIPFPKHLQVIISRIKPEGDLSEMTLIREETSDYLEYQPAKHYIHRVIREIYAPKSKEGSFQAGLLPDSIFEKSKVGVGLVAHLLYSKFVLHLPIDRLFKELLRSKIPTNSATIYNWVKLGIQRLEILYEHQFQQLIHRKYLQVDETTLKVLENHPQKGQCHLGYLWVYNDPLRGETLFLSLIHI